jgi:hypothetical protein
VKFLHVAHAATTQIASLEVFEPGAHRGIVITVDDTVGGIFEIQRKVGPEGGWVTTDAGLVADASAAGASPHTVAIHYPMHRFRVRFTPGSSTAGALTGHVEWMS